MNFTRTLKRYMKGDDVKAVKDKLLELGLLHASTHNKYGNDTYRAVKTFQAANGLDIDGIVGEYTWAALFATEPGAEPAGAVTVPSHIGADTAEAIGKALALVSELRREICLDALTQAIDPYEGEEYPRSFYIRGGNLYNKDLTANVMTESKLNSYFSRSDYAPYYSDGREEMMREAALRSGYTQTGADCSGGIVGLWRKHLIQSSGFDANANTLYGSHCTDTKSPQAGDLAWRSGHIGLVVGGGYIVEWVGGAYGCQLTKMNNRKVFDFIEGRLRSMSKWSAYGDPKKY